MSEFQAFLDGLKAAGASHSINWGPKTQDYQAEIKAAGFNITVLACVVIRLDEDGFDYIFCNGPVDIETGECAIGRPREEKHEGGRFLCKVEAAGINVVPRGKSFKLTDLPHANESDPVDEMAKHFHGLIDHWCPANCESESSNVRLARAFLNMAACIGAQRAVLNGQPPIRPLSSFPGPYTGE